MFRPRGASLADECHPGPVNLSDDLPPPRRPLFFPVVIATVFLSIIGMSAGLVLGSRYEGPRQSGAQDEATYTPTDPPVSSIGCPPQMHDTAARLGLNVRLSQVLRVRVPDTGTTVWICQDEAGELYYQANRGGLDGEWVEGKTALFLTDVVKEDDGYHATAHDGNKFWVNEEQLETVVRGKKQTWDVTPE
jgi:hypothetical protein